MTRSPRHRRCSLAGVRRATAAAIAATALVAPLLSGCGPAAPSTPLGEAFAEALAAASVPGGALAVHRNGESAVYPAGVADLDGTPVTDDTLFGFRSVTKSFVTTVVLQLADEGILDLDAAAPTAGTGVETTATIDALATMTSGIANYSAQPGLIDLLREEWTRSWTDTTLYGLADSASEQFSPGTSYEYSNTNTVLLGQIIDTATGESWPEAIQTGILQPLQLETVVYPGNALPPEGTAAPFQVDADGSVEALPEVRASAFSAAGGLFGTAGDLATWAEALGSGTLVSASAHAHRLGALRTTSPDPHSPYYDEYGFGIGRIGEWIGHTGNGLGYQALAMYHPETETAAAIVLNATGPDSDLPAHLLEQLADLILAD